MKWCISPGSDSIAAGSTMLQPHGTALLGMRPTEWFYFYSNNPSTDIQCVYIYNIIYIYKIERECVLSNMTSCPARRAEVIPKG